MNARQIAWAEQHDWFLYAKDGRVFCRCWYVEANGYSDWEYADFDNISDLRAWAGY